MTILAYVWLPLLIVAYFAAWMWWTDDAFAGFLGGILALVGVAILGVLAGLGAHIMGVG